jgi:hypothetical protein
VLLQPLANAGDGTLIGIWRWMWPMKYPHLAKQKYGNPASRTLFNFRAKFNEQGFNIAPLDVCARGAGKISSITRQCFRFMGGWYHFQVLLACTAGDGSQSTQYPEQQDLLHKMGAAP